MSDNRRGGKREGAGRKPKATELELIEKLSPLDSVALKALADGVKGGDYNYVKLYFEYRYGKPKQQIDASVTGTMDIVWNESRTYAK